MQAVPSLVGTGTAIAAAASGLVFGEAIEPDDSFIFRPASRWTTRQHDHEPRRTRSRTSHLSSSRPGTSSAAPSIRVEAPRHHTTSHPPVVSRPPLSQYQRPKTSRIASPRSPSRRRSVSRPQDQPYNTIAEAPRASFSSTSSWVRRLSFRPSSQHGSPRSSVGPDSASIAFSHGSAAPILALQHPAVPPPTPNKLVKRTSSIDNGNPSIDLRPRSKSHLPTLRRPATSHQRSVTLQQFQAHVAGGTPATPARNSTDQHSPTYGLLPSALEKESVPRTTSGWASFFHSRASSVGGRSAVQTTDRSSQRRYSAPRRVHLFGSDHRQRPHLVKPSMISSRPALAMEAAVPADIEEEPGKSADGPQTASAATENTRSRPARRSISMTFSSAGSWVSRTSAGSLRLPKRGETSRGGNNRHVSDPVATTERGANPTKRVATNPLPHTSPQGLSPTSATISHPSARNRNTSSPVSARPGFPTFDAESLGPWSSGGGAVIQNMRQSQPSGSSTSSAAMSQLRAQHPGRSSTADGSESEPRDFMSGDEDTDFKSDTVFDSLRTGASGRARTVETPLDSMYDESPPSTAGNSKAKRLSIQEILGRDWEGGDKILEEDESAQTPVRPSRSAAPLPRRDIATEPRFSTESGFSANGFGRFSIDDESDDDWARDDDGPYNALSPPSKSSSLNTKGVNPNVRLALATVSGNSVVESGHSDGHAERPLSNLFEWSEPPAYEKKEMNGQSLRPKTAYANQETDARGGRSSNRRGPTPMHVRSQSVPVVHEGPEESKPAGSKYGTWGLGSKTISEDWGDDFEFGGSVENDDQSTEDLFAVPESIQAAQPSVKAHSGQIRELSLLVNDLQRLCRHGRDMDLLDGPQRNLWKEAEGIIALASPDDDSLQGDHETTSSIDLDAFDAHDRFDNDFESDTLDKLDASLDGREPPMSKTAVVRDRPSPCRRSVFSPDDDIFGGNWPLSDDVAQSNRSSRPRTPEPRLNRSPDVHGVVRAVVGVMQQRSITDSLLDSGNASKKMHFDTNSLKILVKRAGDLRDALSDIVRRSDQITQSPVRTPRHERQLESSPAFTKVFDDPGSSPPRRIVQSRGNTSMVDDASPQNSPSSGISRRIHMMTVK